MDIIYDSLTNTTIETDISTVCENLTSLRAKAVRSVWTDYPYITVRDYMDAIGIETANSSVSHDPEWDDVLEVVQSDYSDSYGWGFGLECIVEFNVCPMSIEDGKTTYVVTPSIEPKYLYQ